MHINYNPDKLLTIIENLGKLLKISIIVYDTDIRTLAVYYDPDDYCSVMKKNPEFSQRCCECDKRIIEKCKKSLKTEIHICHAGLYDVAMPVIKDGIPAAYVVFGRIHITDTPHKKHASGNKLYNGMTRFTNVQLKNLTVLLSHIVFDSCISFENDSLFDEISQYIRTHLDSDLSTRVLCRHFYISKNTLYSAFDISFGCTVNKFINSVRIEEAKRLLKATDKKISEIASDVGVENYTYFCRLFKKFTNTTPSKYRIL